MILVNGEPRAEISAMDRGLSYGDGVFETVAVLGGRPRQLERHLRRLTRGLGRLGIGGVDGSLLMREANRVSNGSDRAVLKIIVTRGSGGRGYRAPEVGTPTRIVSLHRWPEYPDRYHERGVDVCVCRTRLGLNASLAGIKHLNRLEQVLARGEWGDEYQEGLMLDAKDRVIEGTMSNLFVVDEDALVTPSLEQAGIAGIMRERILEQARALGIPCRIESFGLERLQGAQGLFLCNSIIGIWPVRRLEEEGFRLPNLIEALTHELGLEGVR